MAQLRVLLVLILRFGHAPEPGRRAIEKLLRVPHNPLRFAQGDGGGAAGGVPASSRLSRLSFPSVPPSSVRPARPFVRTVLVCRENGCELVVSGWCCGRGPGRVLLGCCLGAGSAGWVWDVGPGLGVWMLGCLSAGLLGGCGVCAWVGWWCYGGVCRLVGGGVGRGGAGAAGPAPRVRRFPGCVRGS